MLINYTILANQHYHLFYYNRIISLYHSSMCYVFINIVSLCLFPPPSSSPSFIPPLCLSRKCLSKLDIFLFHIRIRLRSESERERKRIREKKREVYTLAIRVHSRIETQFFHRRVGKGWAGSCGEAEGLYVKQGRQEGGRGAPSYFTVITVTCYRARSLRHAINRRLPLLWW